MEKGNRAVMKPVVNLFNLGWVSASVTHYSRLQGSRLIVALRSEEPSCACRFGGLLAVALTYPTLPDSKQGRSFSLL
jgi:hypothetical protein